MVKIHDPRSDSAAIAMRSLRASKVYKSIKKTIKKCKKFNEDKLNLKKTDTDFYDDFVNCPESIKQELIFLWEEVGDLFEKLEQYTNEHYDDTDTVLLDVDIKNQPKPPEKFNIMGP